MTLHAQPVIPGVGPFVRDVPEDRHAERVVQMMRDFLGELTKQVQPQLDEAMGTRIGCSLKAQQRFLERIEGAGDERRRDASGGDLPPVRRQARPGTGAVPGPGLRHLDRLAMAVPEMPRRLGRQERLASCRLSIRHEIGGN